MYFNYAMSISVIYCLIYVNYAVTVVEMHLILLAKLLLLGQLKNVVEMHLILLAKLLSGQLINFIIKVESWTSNKKNTDI